MFIKTGLFIEIACVDASLETIFSLLEAITRSIEEALILKRKFIGLWHFFFYLGCMMKIISHDRNVAKL